ncbi:hypothetical protein NQ314_001822 [Rhamnusium bicolor]|uniref:Tetratricopeptide repeat protein 17 n=1 Tax=Rhamnusium bicolor TaxID=1586634 RepID=A0AAV8ZSU9_9CUCU|nr:hypothetical protein NQ314_001822 [Rhamnusium bicolor]
MWEHASFEYQYEGLHSESIDSSINERKIQRCVQKTSDNSKPIISCDSYNHIPEVDHLNLQNLFQYVENEKQKINDQISKTIEEKTNRQEDGSEEKKNSIKTPPVLYPKFPTTMPSTGNQYFDVTGWPTKEECLSWNLPVVEDDDLNLPLFLPPENKGYQIKKILSEYIDLEDGSQHELPWYPPVCDYPNVFGDKYIPSNERHKSAPRWVLATLASLYWRVRGNARRALDCLDLAFQIVPKDPTDVVLVSIGSMVYQLGFIEQAMKFATLAFKINYVEPSTNFLLALLHYSNNNPLLAMYYMKNVLRADSEYYDGHAETLLKTWGCRVKLGSYSPMKENNDIPIKEVCENKESFNTEGVMKNGLVVKVAILQDSDEDAALMEEKKIIQKMGKEATAKDQKVDYVTLKHGSIIRTKKEGRRINDDREDTEEKDSKEVKTDNTRHLKSAKKRFFQLPPKIRITLLPKLVQGKADGTCFIFSPTKDECDLCVGYRTKNRQETEHDIHNLKKEETRQEKQKEKGSQNRVFTLNLQSVLLYLVPKPVMKQTVDACGGSKRTNLGQTIISSLLAAEGSGDIEPDQSRLERMSDIPKNPNQHSEPTHALHMRLSLGEEHPTHEHAGLGDFYERMDNAVRDVKSKKGTIRQMAESCKILKFTIHDKVKGIHRLKHGHPPVLSTEEEVKLVAGILKSAGWGFSFLTSYLKPKLDKNDIESHKPYCTDVPRSASIVLDHLTQMILKNRLPSSPEKDLAELLGLMASDQKISIKELGAKIGLALKENTTSWVLATASAIYWRIIGNTEEAVTCIRLALAYVPPDRLDIPLIHLANLLNRVGFHADALDVAHLALKTHHNFVLNHFTVANIHISMGEFEKAVTFYRACLAFDSNFEPARVRLQAVLCTLLFDDANIRKQNDLTD